MQLEQDAPPRWRHEQQQLLLQSRPGQLHGLLLAAIVQLEPGSDLQLACPGQHGRGGHGAALGHHFQRIALVSGQIPQGGRIQLDFGQVGQNLAEGLQTLGECLQVCGRDGGRTRGERRSQGGVQGLDVLVLLVQRQARTGHALPDRFQQIGQAAQHLRPLFARGLGAGRPDQIGGGTLQGLGGFTGRAVDHGAVRQHVGPDMEHEITDAIVHRHAVQHLAQLDGVLDGTGFTLFHLLRQRHATATGLILFAEIGFQETLELRQHGLEHTPPRVRIGLNDLHDAPDFLVQGVIGLLGTLAGEAHHTGTHAVDQDARGMAGGGKEIGLGHRHAQHRHLQAREPHADARRQALFGQDGLKQQGHDLDDGALAGCARGLLEGLLVVLKRLQRLGRVDGHIRARLAAQSLAHGLDGLPQAG